MSHLIAAAAVSDELAPSMGDVTQGVQVVGQSTRRTQEMGVVDWVELSAVFWLQMMPLHNVIHLKSIETAGLLLSVWASVRCVGFCGRCWCWMEDDVASNSISLINNFVGITSNWHRGVEFYLSYNIVEVVGFASPVFWTTPT